MFPAVPRYQRGTPVTRATRDNITGSEFYKHMVINEKRTMVQDIDYAKAAVHEAMHNQYPYWSDDDMHGPKQDRDAGKVGYGGGGRPATLQHFP